MRFAGNQMDAKRPEIQPFQMRLSEIIDGMVEVEAINVEGRPLRHWRPPEIENPRAETRGGPLVNQRR